MIVWIKQLLRRWVLTPDERQLISEAPRAVWRRRVLKQLLRFDQLCVLELMEVPDRWQPEPAITPEEAKGWGQILTSAVGAKIDVAMCNMAQQQAMQACHSPSGETVRQAGFAAGFRAAWLMAKSISTIAGAEAGKHEEAPETGGATLEHLSP